MSQSAETDGLPWRPMLEASGTTALLVAGICLAPLSSEASVTAQVTLCLLILAYVGILLFTTDWREWGLLPADPRRLWWTWGLPLDDDPDSLKARGVMLGLLALITQLAIVPAFFVSFLVETPLRVNPWGYLAWCVVQDTIFFVLIQRNLEVLLPPVAAVAITAVLFGLSHLPYVGFAVITAVMGAVWGTIYLTSRALVCIILSHWVLGLFALPAFTE
ncbi:MAG: lysostaphin resistance A-like protein [Gemmataceae bacterium]